MSERILEQGGNFLTGFLYDLFNFRGSWHNYLHIRVALEVSNPLKWKMKLKRRDNSFVWITFNYECLHTFYFFCDRLWHTDKFCVRALDFNVKSEEYAYGAWLRVVPRH